MTARATVVAVDGGAGSGKSSVSRGVADELHLRFLDTGAMYRAVTWWMLHHDVDPDDATAVAAAAEEAAAAVTIDTDPSTRHVLVAGVDVTEAIRTPEVTAGVSAVSAVPAVRRRLVDAQRQAVAQARADGVGIVVEGRDIGTVVLPDADLKIFLTADPQVRAQRRAAEDADRGHQADVATTAAKLAARDAADSSRAAGPLAQAGDAVVVDGTYDDLPTVIGRVVELVEGIG